MKKRRISGKILFRVSLILVIVIILIGLLSAILLPSLSSGGSSQGAFVYDVFGGGASSSGQLVTQVPAVVTVPIIITTTPNPSPQVIVVTETNEQSSQAQPTLPPTRIVENISVVEQAQLTATRMALTYHLTPTNDASLVEATQEIDNNLPDSGGTISTPTLEPLLMPPDMFFKDYGVNPFLDTEDDNLSTFAMDVDTASYTLARNYLRDSHQLPDPDAIRPEEFINYFNVDYPSPAEDAFAIHLQAAPAPFGYDGHYLLQVGLQGRYVAPEDRQSAVLTFVIDVSGSMSGDMRLGLVKDSLKLLVSELRDDDYVAIVTYADGAKVVLQPTSIREKETILNKISSLQTEGSTYAEAGLRLGYDVAKSVYQEGSINRVILLSDGVANVGETGPDAILNLVADHVSRGITLSTIGVGMGNYNDVLMERLANDGNGHYYYVDGIREARRVFVHNLTSTLQVIAYDAKIQVEFNPNVTDRYRLIGYENRAIADEDFRNDTIDAGEVGAGHHVTALYELALEDDADGIIATVYIRYQDAETNDIVEVAQSITTTDLIPSWDKTAPQWRLLAGVAELSEILRESYWAQDGSYDDLLAWIEPLQLDMIENGQLTELIEMTHRAREYSQK